MATSDLCEVLKRHASGGGGTSSAANPSSSAASSSAYDGGFGGGKMDSATERRICTAVLRLLHDKSNDVQAVAVKTLGVLLTTVHEEQVLEIANSLADQVLDESKSELRDVYAIGLRTLCKTVPAPMGDRVSERLVRRLLQGMAATNQDIVLACLDVLTDLVGRFGATALSLTRQHEPILQQCLTLLGSDAHIIRKRSGNTIGCLSAVLSDALLVRMVESLLSQIDMAEGVGKKGGAAKKKSGDKTGDTPALIRTMCTVSGAVGHRMGQTQIDRILPIFLKFCEPADATTGDDDDFYGDDDDNDNNDGDDDDMMMTDEDNGGHDHDDEAAMALANELRESCFNGFESFVSRCPTEVEPHLEKIIQSTLAYMSYDPNYSYGDGEDEDNEYDDEEGYDDDDELEEDEEDDDDDDDSWKVRRSAIRALTAVVESKKHNPSVLWNKVFDVRKEKSTTVASAFVGRFKEREENCRVDIIDGFNRLLQITVEAAANGVVSFAPAENDDDAMDTESGAVAIEFRSKHAEALVAACEKLLSVKKGGDRSKSSALALLSSFCRAPGGIGGEAAIQSVFGHAKTFLSAGSTGGFNREASANKMLKLDALCLVRVMLECNQHNPQHIKAGLLDNLLNDLCMAVKEKWYKVIAEALRVLTEVPRYFVSGYAGSSNSEEATREKNGVATTLFDTIKPLLAASDVDQEIKECALMATASLLSCLHTNLTGPQLETLLKLLVEKLRNETTRIAAIKTISKVAEGDTESMNDDNKIDLSPILGESISVMGSFLKHQNRSLKQHALASLKMVITNHGSSDPSLADGQLLSTVLQQLANLIGDSDQHLSYLSM